jgi:hypothetical protein
VTAMVMLPVCTHCMADAIHWTKDYKQTPEPDIENAIHSLIVYELLDSDDAVYFGCCMETLNYV